MTAARPVSGLFGAVGSFPAPSFLECTLCPLVVGALFRGLFASSAGGLANCFLHSSFRRRPDLFPGFCTPTVGGRGLCCLEFSLGRLAVGRLVPRIVCSVGSFWVSMFVECSLVRLVAGHPAPDYLAQSFGGWAQCCVYSPLGRLSAMFLHFAWSYVRHASKILRPAIKPLGAWLSGFFASSVGGSAPCSLDSSLSGVYLGVLFLASSFC